MQGSLLTTKEAALCLGVSEAFLERDRWAGARVPFIKIGSRAVRYRLQDLEHYRILHPQIHQRYGAEMSAAIWPISHPEGAYVREDGVIFYREEEESFTSEILSRHPDCLAEAMAQEYARLYQAHGEEKAEAYLKAISDQLSGEPLSLSATDEEIDAFAARLADQFFRLQRYFNDSAIGARFLGHLTQSKYGVSPLGKGKAKLQSARPLSLPVTEPARKPLWPVSVTEKSNISVPVPETPVTVTGKPNPSFPVSVTDTGITHAGILARLADEYWWRQALRTVHMRHFEHSAICLGLVHSRKGKYVSDETMKRRRKQIRRNRAILENCIATNELGQEYTLQQLAELSVSNPKIRRAELMTRIAGFDSVDQFQQIGGPPVTVWRELRRMGEMGVIGELKKLREAADKGKWERFVMLMGGPEAKRKDFPISLAKQWIDKPNRYKEPKGNKIIGITWEKTEFPTRIHQWPYDINASPIT